MYFGSCGISSSTSCSTPRNGSCGCCAPSWSGATWTPGLQPDLQTAIAQTLAMAFLGTPPGHHRRAGRGLPLAARNVMRCGWCARSCGASSTSCAAFDSLVWGLVFVRAVGSAAGRRAGDLRVRPRARCPSSIPRRSRTSTASRWRACARRVRGQLGIIRYGYIPRVLPVFISQSLYFPGIQPPARPPSSGSSARGAFGMIINRTLPRLALRPGGLRGAERTGADLRD